MLMQILLPPLSECLIRYLGAQLFSLQMIQEQDKRSALSSCNKQISEGSGLFDRSPTNLEVLASGHTPRQLSRIEVEFSRECQNNNRSVAYSEA